LNVCVYLMISKNDHMMSHYENFTNITPPLDNILNLF